MRYFCLIISISLLPIVVFGQINYFSSDSTTVVGINIINGGALTNSQICQVIKGDSIIHYTPFELKEYGFRNGQVYISKDIQIGESSKRVFLERVVSGKTSLYYYAGKGIKTFYIQKDSTSFIEVPKQNAEKEKYSAQLLNLTKDCPAVSNACMLATYSKKSLSEVIERYNYCEFKPFPHFRYGFLFGYDNSKLILYDRQYQYLQDFDFSYDGSFSFGLFLDNPILLSDFSLHVELLFSKHGYTYNELVENRDLDFVANFTSLNVPLLVRYSFPSNRIRPFCNAGITGTYFVRNSTHLYETTMYETTIKINGIENTTMTSDFQLGYVFGGGLEYILSYKKSLFFELRYCNQYNPGDFEFLGSSSFSILSGINF